MAGAEPAVAAALAHAPEPGPEHGSGKGAPGRAANGGASAHGAAPSSGAPKEPHHRHGHRRRLLHYHELEAWRQDNHWIFTGYRVSDQSYATCVDSLFFLHNESGNVYSHLLGALAFVGIAAYTFATVEMEHWFDSIVFSIFFVGAFLCLFSSAVFHLMCSHSYEVSLALNRCDYAGITLMIVGSTFPLVYFAFNCEWLLQVGYLGFITLCGAFTMPFIMMERFSTPAYRLFRAMLYVVLALAGLFPLFHLYAAKGWAHMFNAASLHWTLIMGAVYMVGTILYAFRFPERSFPGSFDYFFHSHQIFHVCVLVAALIHYVGLMEAYEWHRASTCPTVA